MPTAFAEALDQALAALAHDDVIARLHARDHTLWSEHPTEISDRLGWLDAPQTMRHELPRLAALAAEARHAGVRDVVLCGMGGSSLGAEVVRQVCGQGPGSPTLSVLDSTVPDWVRRVRAQIDPATTWFLISSKSGSTAEVSALFHFFWAETASALGREKAARHFLAITDPGSSLAALASERAFRHCFENPPDVGGRFSVLTFFGLVPAALLGLDLRRFLGSAGAMATACDPQGEPATNPGARLGAAFAAAVASGRPLLTLLASPRLASFGLWAEQLIAESTGKGGTGLVPIAAEPLADADECADDRLFVALRLRDDPAHELDRLVASLRAAGRPLVELELADPVALGGELYRWELATAVAGHLMHLQPFDQPDVEATKRETKQLLTSFRQSGALPAIDTPRDLRAALAAPPRPSFVALLAYSDASPEFEELVARLRRRLLVELGVATTFGYGPRYLHSTGQLHKGGPPGGLFVQLLGWGDDLPIPGEPFGFGTLARAQADGDLLALRAAYRRAVRVELGADPERGLAALLAKLD